MIDTATFVSMVRNTSGDSNRLDFIKKQHNLIKGFDKNSIIAMTDLVSDTWKLDIIRYFKNYFSASDVPELLNVTNSETWQLDIVKVFSYSAASKTTILTIIGKFRNDTWIMYVIKYFKSWFYWSDVIQLMSFLKGDIWKYDLIRLFNYTGVSKSEIIKIITHIEEDTWRLDGVKYFSTWFSNVDIAILCGLMKTEEFKIKVLDLFPWKNNNITVREFDELINQFRDDRAKFTVLEKKIKDDPILNKEMINLIGSFKEERYRKKVCILLFTSDRNGIFDTDCFISVIGMFPVPQRMTLLTEYRKNHVITSEKIVPVIKELNSKGNAIKYLKDIGIADFNTKLVEAGYSVNDISKTDEDESESESEAEPELEPEWSDDESDNSIIETNIMGLGQKITYDCKRDIVLFGGSVFHGTISFNGVDIKQEALYQGREIVRKRREKKNQLKVPHAWKDEKINDETNEQDECVVCREKKRMISLSCGHYHTCSHCTRVLLRGNKQCPVCRAEITSVLRIFA